MLKKIVSLIMAAVLAAAGSVTVYAAKIPSDIAGHWAEEKITLAITLHMFDEAPELLDKFEPDKSLTRVEFCGVLNRLNGFTEEADVAFSDVTAGTEYEAELRRAVKAGYFFGDDENRAYPDRLLTRAEASSMLYRIGKYPKAAGASKIFTDYDKIPSWAVEAVDACVKRGLWSGDNGRFRPGDNITRAEFVALAYNLLFVIK